MLTIALIPLVYAILAEQWGSTLGKVLSGKRLDAVIDSAGGDIFGQIGRVLRPGGTVVCYGMFVAFIFSLQLYTNLHLGRAAQ